MIKFSVIIPLVNGVPTIFECLMALEAQKCSFDFEIIVVDRTYSSTAKIIRKDFPAVKLIKVSAVCGIPEMRYTAMNLAKGEFFAVIEDHCLVPKDWLAKIADAHQAGYGVVGGAVANLSCERIIDRAVFLCEYSSFMPPLTGGEVDFVTGNNTSYQSSLIKSLSSSLLKNSWEYFLLIELKRNKIKFLAIPSLIVNHKKEFSFLYFMGQRFHYSRSFAAMRKQGIVFTKRILYLSYIPFLPFHQIWKIFQNVKNASYSYWDFFLLLPYLFFFMMSYALGELTGYLFGSGESLAKVE